MQSATFLQRLLAFLIDATLLLLAQALVLFVVLLVFGLDIPEAHLLAIGGLAGLVLDSGLAWQEANGGGPFGKIVGVHLEYQRNQVGVINLRYGSYKSAVAISHFVLRIQQNTYDATAGIRKDISW
mgnify:CR=1 FL=1